jgi:hypothetical protein
MKRETKTSLANSDSLKRGEEFVYDVLTTYFQKKFPKLTPEQAKRIVDPNILSSAIQDIANGDYPVFDYGATDSPFPIACDNKTSRSLHKDITFQVWADNMDQSATVIRVEVVKGKNAFTILEFPDELRRFSGEEKIFLSIKSLHDTGDMDILVTNAVAQYLARHGQLELTKKRKKVFLTLTCPKAAYRSSVQLDVEMKRMFRK